MDDQPRQTDNYRALFRKVVLIILFTAITPTVVVSIFILDEFRISYQRKVYDHLGLLARKHKRSIDLFLEEKLMDIRLLAGANSFAELSDEPVLNRKFVEIQRAFDRAFVDIGVVNHTGRQIAYAGPYDLSGVDYSETEWFKKAIANPYFISDVFKGLRGAPHFIVTVRHEHDGKPWVLRATIDFGEFNNLVEYLRMGDTGFAFILNQDGELQTNPIAEVIPDQVVRYLKQKDILERPYSISRMKNRAGKEVIYTMTSLKNGEWLMVLQQDYADAFAEFNNTRKIAYLIMLIGSLGIIACTLILSHRLIQRISLADEEKQTADKEKEIMSQQVIETGKLASIGELAAGIAHEINNPVAIMIEEAGWVQDLLEEEEFQEGENLKELHRALKQINTQGRRCKEITHKLLSFARKTDSRVGDVFLNKLLEEIVYLSSQRAKYGNIELITELEEGLPPISASETEMQQVLLNLVNNAMDAMDKTGGTLTLTSRLENDTIAVVVSDTGPGIAEANLPRLFDPFFTTKPVGKGTGLGLSICFGIIKKIGGDIEVRSAIGQGTDFEIKLPIDRKSLPENTNVPVSQASATPS
ncbi:MAG: cache domain-containing protein [Desulfobacterales bacterium]